MTHNKCSPRAIRICLLFVVTLASAVPASAKWKEKVLYSFQGGSDGLQPAGGVVFDKAGNLYGANSWGGTACGSSGCGTVFQLSPPVKKGGAWTETIIHAFQGLPANDGYTPEGGLIIDSAGNLYGTTSMGGSGPCVLLGSLAGCGIVYELSPPAQQGGQWTYVILYDFQGTNDGYFPWGNLTLDKAGNLYGATQFGGGQGYDNCNKLYGFCGTVFEVSPPKKKGGIWTEQLLHSFAGGTDGANPNGGLVLDSKGAIYGTTYFGGSEAGECGGTGCGTVFKLIPPIKQGDAWSENVLHRFDIKDGANPAAGVIFDGSGNLYGTTVGTVFRLALPSKKSGRWKEMILYTFNQDAYGPQDSLIFDQSNNLYGTTYSGNTFSGAVFQLKPPSRKGGSWTFGILYGFTGRSDGAQPAANLIFDKRGKVYGTTQKGGTGTCSFYGCGTVFEVSP